jgi:histidine triad (HIT) family protein
MSSLFSKIVKGQIPCYKVAETNDFLAFLDINPNAKGHTLCIPKKEIDELFELDNNTYNGLMKFSREVAIALKKTIPCNRIGMSVIGLEVPHVHVHLIPINSMEDMQFIKKLDKQTPSEFREVAEAISKNL